MGQLPEPTAATPVLSTIVGAVAQAIRGDTLSEEEKAVHRATKAKSKEIEKEVNRDHVAAEMINKVLLMGAGDSGKREFLMTLVRKYGERMSEEERKTFKPLVHSIIISSLKTLSEQSVVFGPVKSSAAQEAKRYVDSELKGNEEIDEQLGLVLKTLWQDSGIQRTFEFRAKYRLTDNAQYFLDKIDQVLTDDRFT